MTTETTDETVDETTEMPADEKPRLVIEDLERALEAILMVADEPISLVSLATGLGAPVPAVRQSIERLVADYDGTDGGVRRGFELREVGGGWRIYVRPEHDDAVREFVLTQNPTKLSQAALETLAVIAYRQPVSRGQVSGVRGVSRDRDQHLVRRALAGGKRRLGKGLVLGRPVGERVRELIARARLQRERSADGAVEGARPDRGKQPVDPALEHGDGAVTLDRL